MTNPNSRIITHTFPFGLHSHTHAPLLPLLFLAAATPYAAAQMSTESSPSSNYPYTNFDPPTAIIILVLVCAFFFVAFFSIYLRHCINVTAAEPNSANSTAARLRRFPRGLDPKVIESFPIFHYSEIKDQKIGKGTLECAVCINEFEDDETLRLLPKCNHVFHSDCIDAWLASHSTCPVCRANLVLEEVNQSNESIDEHNFRTELSEVMQNENQISISINVEEEEDDEENRDPEASEFPKQNRKREVKFQRSHSTGHSLLGLGESCERYTLRLPEEVRKQIMLSGRLKRTRSCIVVLPMEGTSRGRFDRAGRLDRWIFSMTPPFFSKNNRSKAGSTET